jgi:phosphohistidine swiveling domain-containing protein
MTELYVDNDRYSNGPGTLIVKAFHGAIKDMIRRKLEASGGDWESFVFGASNDLITIQDLVAVEKKIVDTGYRFDWSAMISVKERPEIYKPALGAGDDMTSFSFEHQGAILAAVDDKGREQRGVGDNVVRRKENTTGIAHYIRSSERVIDYMTNGVPADTIAIIDDSGGTLTAPILEQFKGVICAGGTIRSHLGILTREYGIPCLMNAKISGILEGDRVEIETSAQAKTAEAYQAGEEMTARVWRFKS